MGSSLTVTPAADIPEVSVCYNKRVIYQCVCVCVCVCMCVCVCVSLDSW